MRLAWPERFGLGVFLLCQPLVILMLLGSVHHGWEEAFGWERAAALVAFLCWLVFRALALMFTPQRP